jgi:hypothetical protein
MPHMGYFYYIDLVISRIITAINDLDVALNN